jgi:transcriptional regulator with XRE-family HTH domain
MTNQEIGAIIKDIRNRRGLSIRALGELSGVQFANIGKLERGEYNPSVNILNKILLALNCELIVKEKDNNTKVSNYEES